MLTKIIYTNSDDYVVCGETEKELNNKLLEMLIFLGDDYSEINKDVDEWNKLKKNNNLNEILDFLDERYNIYIQY